jgi:hypothetical protein
MIHAVALDHRTVRIDENRKRQRLAALIGGHVSGALTDDDHDLGSQGMIGW